MYIMLEIIAANELDMKLTRLRGLKYSSLERELTFHMNSSPLMAVVIAFW